MKNKFLTAIAAVALMGFASCSDDSSDSFDDANGDVAKKYIKTITTTSSDSDSDTVTLTVNYDSAGKVTSATDGTETSFFAYDDGNLQNISGSGDVLNIPDLLSTPQDAYEVGDVLDYDADGNPVKVRIFERDWDGSIYAEYTGEITYDDKPNPYYYTLEAAGIIKVLDDLDLNFSMTPQSQELIKAKLLLPVHNPKKVVIKDVDGSVKKTIVTDYVYNSDEYPVSATATETSEYGTYIYVTNYTYK
jgi:YD repeat-containing protein